MGDVINLHSLRQGGQENFPYSSSISNCLVGIFLCVQPEARGCHTLFGLVEYDGLDTESGISARGEVKVQL